MRLDRCSGAADGLTDRTSAFEKSWEPNVRFDDSRDRIHCNFKKKEPTNLFFPCVSFGIRWIQPNKSIHFSTTTYIGFSREPLRLLASPSHIRHLGSNCVIFNPTPHGRGVLGYPASFCLFFLPATKARKENSNLLFGRDAPHLWILQERWITAGTVKVSGGRAKFGPHTQQNYEKRSGADVSFILGISRLVDDLQRLLQTDKTPHDLKNR